MLLLILSISLFAHASDSCTPRTNCGANPGGITTEQRVGDHIRITRGTNIEMIQRRGNQAIFDRLEQISQHFPGKNIVVFSGYRSPEHNRCVCGATASRHIQADALDFNINASPEAVKQFLGTLPGGRGSYGDGSYHIDLGASRCWSGMTNYCRETRVIAEAQRTDRQRLATLASRQQNTNQAVSQPANYNPSQYPDTVDAYRATNPDRTPTNQDDLFRTTRSYFGAGIPTINGNNDASGSSSENQAGGHASSSFVANIPFVSSPHLCRSAGEITVEYCQNNYQITAAAEECLYRLREAELVAAQVVKEKVVQHNLEKQNLNFRDSSHDYRIGEAISTRYANLLRASLAEVQQYPLRFMLPEDMNDSSAGQEPCWRDNMRDVNQAVTVIQQRIVQAEANARANGYLKQDTKASQRNIKSADDESDTDIQDALQDFDQKVRQLSPP